MGRDAPLLSLLKERSQVEKKKKEETWLCRSSPLSPSPSCMFETAIVIKCAIESNQPFTKVLFPNKPE